MTAQLSMFAAPGPTRAPLPPPVPRYGWRWVSCPLGGRPPDEGRMRMCEPKEGVTAFIEHEHWHEGGRLHEEFEWKVIGVGGLQKGIALTFDGAAEAARRAVDNE